MFAEKMIIHAVADGRVFSFFNPNNPILVTVELPYRQVTLPKAGDEPLRIPVIAKVQQVIGMEENGQLILQPVPDGTPVGWWVERGRIQNSMDSTVNGIATATIVLGQISSSSESTLLLTFFNEKPDEQMLIKVSVPGNFAGSATLQLLPNPNSSLSAYLTQPVLVGDEPADLAKFPIGLNTPDGIVLVDSVDDLMDDEVLGDDFETFPYFTHSVLKIWGKPNGKVKVAITKGGEYIQIAGYRLPTGGWVLFPQQDVQQIPELLLDGQGQGEVLIVSKGTLPSDSNNHWC